MTYLQIGNPTLKDFTNDTSIDIAYKRATRRNSIGKDGVDIKSFQKHKKSELNLIKERIKNGKYRFTPYLEKLIPKTHDSYPRRISIPTVRDKIALKVIDDYLRLIFFESAQFKHQLAIVDKIKRYSQLYSYFVKFDISGYYSNIPHDKLLDVLRERIHDDEAIKIIHWAINNPTTPMSHKGAKEFSSRGIPQGLSISNILGEIYANKLDTGMSKYSYSRYVDDIIIFAKSHSEIEEIKTTLSKLIKSLGLEFNEKKFDSGHISKGFEYLGYHFDGIDWLIKKETLERQFRSIHAIFTKFKHEINAAKNQRKKNYKRVIYARFVDDLNNRISGAIFERTKHGFTFYYSKITNIKQLHQLDAFVEENLQLIRHLSTKENRVKNHVQSYFAWRSDYPEEYITQYGLYLDTQQKFDYLEKRDLVHGGPSRYSAQYINEVYERYIRKKLRYIDDFTGNLS